MSSFWDSVANIYSNNSMTKHEGDHEMMYVFETIQKYFQNGISNMACFGAADGSRDPMCILEFLKENKKFLPKELIVNDISPEFIKICKEKFDLYRDINCEYHAKPIHEVKLNNKYKSVYVNGLYNADYFMQSLSLYLENKEIIGTKFKVWPLEFNGLELKRTLNVPIEFDINNYNAYASTFEKLRSNGKFLAFSLETDKNFISHYYDAKNVELMYKSVFGEKFSSVKCIGNRYIVLIIKSNTSDHECLITTLNNVMGNVKYDQLLNSLENINWLIK